MSFALFSGGYKKVKMPDFEDLLSLQTKQNKTKNTWES
jgi:hypothetical protein